MIKGPWPRQSTTATLWKHSVVVCLQRKREGARAVGRKKVEREREREREKDLFVLVSNWLLLCDVTGFLHLSHIWHTNFLKFNFVFKLRKQKLLWWLPSSLSCKAHCSSMAPSPFRSLFLLFFPYTHYFFSVAHLHNLKDFSISLAICTCGSSSFFSLFPSVLLFVFWSVL
jgi:hypothetical protein